MLTEFNEGGSHESSPLGGIPMGMNSNGQMNTVEQGETKAGQFVYSDRLYINEDLAKQMNLPGYIKGKSFAGASKAINNKFKDRNDIHTKATQKELLDRLAQSQEQLKAEQEAINQSMQINQSEPEYPEDNQMAFGGLFTASPERQEMQANRKYYKNLFKEGSITRDQFRGYKQDLRQDFRSGISNGLIGANNGAIPFNSSFEPGRYDHKLNQKMLFQQFGGGGMMGMNFSTQDSAMNPDGGAGFAGGGQSMSDKADENSNMGTYGQMAGQLGEMIGQGGSYGKSMQSAYGVGFNDTKLQEDQKSEQMLGKTKDTISSVLGPFGALFRGIQKAGKGLGDSIGGEGGAAVSGAFSPEEATMSNMTNKDMSVGQKLLGTVPGVGAVMAKNAADKRLREFNDTKARVDNFYKYQFNENDEGTKVFALGGEIDPPATRKDSLNVLNRSIENEKAILAKGYKLTNTYPAKHDLYNLLDSRSKNISDKYKNNQKTSIIKDGVRNYGVLNPKDYAGDLGNGSFYRRDLADSEINLDFKPSLYHRGIQPINQKVYKSPDGNDVINVGSYNSPEFTNSLNKKEPVQAQVPVTPSIVTPTVSQINTPVTSSKKLPVKKDVVPVADTLQRQDYGVSEMQKFKTTKLAKKELLPSNKTQSNFDSFMKERTNKKAYGGELDGKNPWDLPQSTMYDDPSYIAKSIHENPLYRKHNSQSGIPYANNGLIQDKNFPQIRNASSINSVEDFRRNMNFDHPDDALMYSKYVEERDKVNPNMNMFEKMNFRYSGNPIKNWQKWSLENENRLKDYQSAHNNSNPNSIKLTEDGKAGPMTYTAMGLRTDGSEFPMRLDPNKALESALETPDSEIKPDYTLEDIKNMETNYNTNQPNVDKNGKKLDPKKVGDYLNNALRYAPILGNVLQKANIGPAEVESAIKNPYQYKKQYIDEAAYRNAADQQSALTMEALNKSGLSGNQLMAASLGSQLARTKGVAEGAMAAKMHNLNENKIAEQVKQQNEGDFITDSRYVRETNAQNRANRDTQISKFDSEIYNSLGEIGKEETFKKQAEKLTGYKMMGEYIMTDPNYKSQYEAIQKDSKLTPKEKYAMTRNLIKEASSTFDEESYKKVSDALIETAKVGHAYGGYMSPKFKKY